MFGARFEFPRWELRRSPQRYVADKATVSATGDRGQRLGTNGSSDGKPASHVAVLATTVNQW